MMLAADQRARVIEAMDEATGDALFQGRPLWLTFYLNAPQESLEALAPELAGLGAQNLGGAEGGFIYPKIPIADSTAATADVVDRVLSLCDEYNVKPLTIDLDTDPDVTRAKFRTLLEFEW